MFPGYSIRCGGLMSEPDAALSEPDAELREAFHEEVTRRLEEMETVLLAIESGDPGYGMIDSLFRNVHTIKGTAGMFGLDDVAAVAHAAEDILAVIRDTGMFPPSMVDPLLHVTSVVRARVNGDDVPVDALLEELTAGLAALSQPGSGKGAEGTVPAGPDPGSPDQDVHEPAMGVHSPIPGQRSVRVTPAKIDHLLDVIGEALQDGRRLTHELGAGAYLPEPIVDALGASARTLDELKDTAIKMRTLPLAVIAGPLPRAVRDLARAVGKDVGFAMAGADTEIDRVILESP